MGASVPVSLRGEDSDHGGPLVDLQHVSQRLENVEVEEGISGDRTVESCLHGNMMVTNSSSHSDGAAAASPSETRSSIAPELWENLRYHSYTLEPLGRTPPGEREDTPLRAEAPPLHGRQMAVRYLAQRGVLHRHLTQEEVHVVPVVDGVQEVRLCNIKTSTHQRQAAVGMTTLARG